MNAYVMPETALGVGGAAVIKGETKFLFSILQNSVGEMGRRRDFHIIKEYVIISKL